MIDDFLKNPTSLGVAGLLLAAIILMVRAFLADKIMTVSSHNLQQNLLIATHATQMKQLREDFVAQIAQMRADYDRHILVITDLYEERLTTSNTSASEWREMTEKSLQIAKQPARLRISDHSEQ